MRNAPRPAETIATLNSVIRPSDRTRFALVEHWIGGFLYGYQIRRRDRGRRKSEAIELFRSFQAAIEFWDMQNYMEVM